MQTKIIDKFKMNLFQNKNGFQSKTQSQKVTPVIFSALLVDSSGHEGHVFSPEQTKIGKTNQNKVQSVFRETGG